MDQAPTGRLPMPRTRSLNSLATATGDAEAKRAAIRGRSPSSVRVNAPPPPPGAGRVYTIPRPSPSTSTRSVSPSPRSATGSTTTRTPSVMSTTGARTLTRPGAPPPPPAKATSIRAPSPASRRASMPQIDDDGLPESVSGAAATEDAPRVRTHTRSASTASEPGLTKPASRATGAPSFLTRPKTTDKRVSTTRAPPPAPVRKVPPSAAAKAQELQLRLDALKKTAEQLRAKSVHKPGSLTGLKRPGEKSAPASPKTSLKPITEKDDQKGVGEQDANKTEEESAVNAEQEEQDRKEKQLTIQRDMSLKEEREKFEAREREEDEILKQEAENERARKEQELLVKEQQAKKDSLQVRAAAALERKLNEERRVEKEKQDKKQREEEEAEIKSKEVEAQQKREREIEEEEAARKKQEQAEREELARKREQEEREERQRDEEHRAREKQAEEEEEERQRVALEKEREEIEKRRQEQERLLQETEEAEREEVRKRIEREEAERKQRKEEEDRKRAAAEEERRKQKAKEEEDRKKQEEERRKQREKEEEERRNQKLKEEEERRKQREREEEERRKQSEREAEARRKQKEEEEARKQKEKEVEDKRRKEKEEDDKRKEEEAEKKRVQEEEARKRVAKEKEEADNKRKVQEEEEKRKKAAEQERQEKEKKDLEDKKVREEKFRLAKQQAEERDNANSNSESSSNLSTVTKAKMAGGGVRKARSGMKFDASASTDVVKAPKPGDHPFRSESHHSPAKEEPKESDLRPERKPFMGAGMNGLAGLAAQASAGLAGLKPLARTGDRSAVKSPGARKGPFEIAFKTDGKKEMVVVNEILDVLDNVAKGQFWAILGFDNEVFSLVASGEGVGQSCLDGMKEYLTPTNICFIYFNNGSTAQEEGNVKCTEIMWQGEKTKLLVKARAGAMRETLHLFTKRCFTVGVQKEASAHDDLDVSRIYGSSGEVTASPVQSSPAPEVRYSPSPSSYSPSPSPQLLSTPQKSFAIPPLATRTPPTAAEFKAASGSNPLRPDIQWTGQDDIVQAVKEFLAAEGSGVFFALDIEGPKKNEVKVAGAGVGALTDEWRDKYCVATKCSVFVIKAENKESGYVSLEKIVYIQWVGRQVKILEKGRAKEIYSGLKEFVREQCGTLAGELEVLEGQASDVNLQAVTESITGSRQRGNASLSTSAKKVERATGAPVDLSYADEDELRSIIGRISEEKLTWVALTYSANKAATLEILGSGVGENTSISWGKEPTKEQEDDQNKRDRQADTPTAQYKKFCKQSNIVFIVHRFLRIPEQFQFSKDMGSYAKSHFGLMMWQGEDCRVMDKAASSHHWKDFCTLVRDVMEKAGVYVEAGVYVATKMDELNPRDIRKGMRMDMY